MANTIRQYLVEVEDRLRTSLDDATLQQVLAETENHLRESADEIRDMGMSRLEAERAAVQAFGESEVYGSAVESVDSLAARTGPRPVLKAALITTGILLLWPLLIRPNGPRVFGEDIPAHILGTLGSMMPWIVPIVGIVAFLTGSRAKVRSLFFVALAGGVVMTPILAARFVGSDIRGGYPVRGLMLREAVIGEPELHFQAAKYTGMALNQLDLDLQWVKEGRCPFLLGDQKSYLGPPVESESITSPQLSLDSFVTPDEAMHRWKLYGDSFRARYEAARTWQANEAVLLQQALDEPFLQRWVSVWPYALLMGLVWGALLVMMQGIGLTLRRLTLMVLRKSGWTRNPQTARH